MRTARTLSVQTLFGVGLIVAGLHAQSVGIGTATPHPSARLHISDNARGLLIPNVALTATNVAAPVTSPATSLLVYNTNTAGTGATAVSPGFYYWDGSRWVRLLGGGEAWLLNGNAGTNPAVNFLGTTDAQPLVIRTNNTERMRVTETGFVGIGTISPTDRLQVAGGNVRIGEINPLNTGSFPGYGRYLYFSGGPAGSTWDSENSDLLWLARYNAASDRTELRVNIGDNCEDDAFVVGTSGSACAPAGERWDLFRVHTNGRVGIGTTTPVEKVTIEPYYSFSTANITPSTIIPFGTRKIGLSSDRGIYLIDDTDFIGLALKNEGADRKDGVIYWGDNLGADNLRFMFAEWNGSFITLRDRMIITSYGNVGIGTTSPAYRLHVVGDVYATGEVYCYGWAICSDQRWKTNIKPIQNALDNVLKMQGVTYYWKVDEYPDKHFPEGEQIGFIAQEIEKVYPQVVHTDKDGHKSVDYSKLTPVLVEAIKEQQKIIEELQKAIQQLQEENSQIKQANAQLSAEIKMLNEKVDNLINSLSNDKKLGYR